MSDSKRAFWSSIPGLLTGTAGVVTAIVGLTTVLIQLDVIGDKGSDDSPSTTVAGETVPEPGATTVPRTGTGATAPTFTVTPESVEFALLTREADVTVRNTGSTPLRVTTQVVGADPGQFSADARDCTSAAVATSCVVKLRYAPSGAGEHVARLQVSAQGAAAPKEVRLTGGGL